MDRSERMKAHAQAQREEWAIALKDSDAEILAMRDVEKLTLRQMQTRLGISWNAARYRVLAARRREAIRKGLPAKV